MTLHRSLDEGALGMAALHALGALDVETAREFESHLRDCPLCRVEVLTLREVAGELAFAASPAEPPASLRERVLARALGASPRARPLAADEPARLVQAWKTWATGGFGGDFAFALSKDAVWEPTGAEGVEARKLFVDPANDRATMLIRMAPGASYPRHRHAAAEECYVIEGDFLVGDTRMRAGDYHRACLGSTHGIQSTENGCVLLIVSSLHDELLAEKTR